jgi:hypothetical protein
VLTADPGSRHYMHRFGCRGARLADPVFLPGQGVLRRAGGRSIRFGPGDYS